jgi:hypothetical protein
MIDVCKPVPVVAENGQFNIIDSEITAVSYASVLAGITIMEALG